MATERDPALAAFLVQLVASHLNEKHKVSLSDRWNMLKEMRYKGGSVLHHRVKGRKLPSILPVSPEVRRAEEQKLEELKEARQVKPDFRLFLEDEQGQMALYDGDEAASPAFRLEYDLPLLIHGRGIELLLDQQTLSLRVGSFYAVALRLPFRIDEAGLRCEFRQASRRLVVDGRRCPPPAEEDSGP